MIFAVSPHDRAGNLIVRSDFPPQSGERPSYVFPALSRTRHEFLLPSARHKANETDVDQPRNGSSCGREGEWLTPRLQVWLGPLQLLHQVQLLKLDEPFPELLRAVGPFEELAHIFYVLLVGKNELPALFDVHLLKSAGRQRHDVPGLFDPALLAQEGVQPGRFEGQLCVLLDKDSSPL